MGKRYGKKKRRHGSKKLPLAVILPAAWPVAEEFINMGHGKTGAAAGRSLLAKYTGIMEDGSWNVMHSFKYVYGPLLVGVVAHKLVGKTVSRVLPKWVPVTV